MKQRNKNNEMKWKFTTIHHPARKALGVSPNEYCIYDIIYQTQTSPKYSKNGWADNSYQKMADFFGFSKGTIHPMIDRGVEKGLIEVDPSNPRLKRTTDLWNEVIYEDHANMESIEALISKIKNRSKSERAVRNPNDILNITPNISYNNKNRENENSEKTAYKGETSPSSDDSSLIPGNRISPEKEKEKNVAPKKEKEGYGPEDGLPYQLSEVARDLREYFSNEDNKRQALKLSARKDLPLEVVDKQMEVLIQKFGQYRKLLYSWDELREWFIMKWLRDYRMIAKPTSFDREAFKAKHSDQKDIFKISNFFHHMADWLASQGQLNKMNGIHGDQWDTLIPYAVNDKKMKWLKEAVQKLGKEKKWAYTYWSMIDAIEIAYQEVLEENNILTK
jgi:DNA-binding MarR family transcriptional regulator